MNKISKEDLETQCKLICEYCETNYPKLYWTFYFINTYKHGNADWGHTICQANDLRRLFDEKIK